MKFLMNEWFLFPVISICVIVIVYMWFEKILGFMHKRSLGQREEIVRLFGLMFIDMEKGKITLFLLVFSFGLGFSFFLLLWPSFLSGILVGSIVTLVCWSIPLPIVKVLYDKRCSRLVEQMVDGLTIMSNGIKSGLTVTQGMERVVDNMGAPISQEFNLVLSQIRIGRSVEEALIDLGERIPKPDVQMFVTAINILKETGGNMGETFSTIVTTIRERQKVEKKIEAMTAQGLMQGLIVSLVPLILIIVFLFTDPNYIMPMFTTTLGLIILFFVFALIILGGVTVMKIVKIKV